MKLKLVGALPRDHHLSTKYLYVSVWLTGWTAIQQRGIKVSCGSKRRKSSFSVPVRALTTFHLSLCFLSQTAPSSRSGPGIWWRLTESSFRSPFALCPLPSCHTDCEYRTDFVIHKTPLTLGKCASQMTRSNRRGACFVSQSGAKSQSRIPYMWEKVPFFAALVCFFFFF